jgi:hypothetical protein
MGRMMHWPTYTPDPTRRSWLSLQSLAFILGSVVVVLVGMAALMVTIVAVAGWFLSPAHLG